MCVSPTATKRDYELKDCISLLKAAREATKPCPLEYNAIVSDILQEHVTAIRLSSHGLAAQLEQDLRDECQQLRQCLGKIPTSCAIGREEEDSIVKFGEKLSARFVAALLEDHGLPSQYVDLSNIINFGLASTKLNQEFYQHLAEVIGEKIRLCGDKIPVLTGFFGSVPGGLLASCGRGYSDLCAALAAVGSDAKELQVWKEVSGVYTAYVRVSSALL